MYLSIKWISQSLAYFELDVAFLAPKFNEVTKFLPLQYEQKWCVNF